MHLERPKNSEIKKYILKWETLENYVLQERSLNKLFKRTYPKNNDIDEVLIKVCSLNDFYSTNIYSPFSVAKHIVNLNIDQKLHDNDLSLVNELALVEIKKGHTRNFYSFATKYCSHHRPDIFPIYDQYVGRLLMKFKRDDKFAIFVKPELKNYSRFNEILMEFRDFYSLEEFCLKDIDKYLWQAGKEYFSKNK